MKKLLFVPMLFMMLFLSNSCSEKDNEKLNSDPSDGAKIEMSEYSTTIPVSIDKTEKQAKVAFILSAQFYTIELSNENKATIELIENAIQEEYPVHIYLKKGTNEILKVTKASDAELKHFKTIYTKEVGEIDEKAAKLLNVIPSQAVLNSLFTSIKNQSCGVATNSCISFRYAVDGCYARAHKMKQILEDAGYSCKKQFVYGNLKASTGTCCVSWNYHVAVLVSFKNASGVKETRIIDPSLFSNGAVTEQEWRNACINQSCGSASITTFANAPSNVFYRNSNGKGVIYDKNYAKTDCVLNVFKDYVACALPAPSIGVCGL
ncbi:protein-glutamine glutaminase [Flavobacterium sp. '19STA2R22 D10 B1']|uniref:protein-glutamine glutaminase n=1 Tax=Flavobacterium aerium TaxID=3037261 RepID=UPI00278C5AAE|nr:protein-glutamine glutaminase [Flavobacterium sp. '19STA2R22 D10 B1']